MRIAPISLKSSVLRQTRSNFGGISSVVSKKFVETGSFGGDQGDYNKYIKVMEYRPFADETQEEIDENIKKLTDVDIKTYEPYTYPGSYTVYPDADVTYTEVVVGERLHCTKEEATLIASQALRK